MPITITIELNIENPLIERIAENSIKGYAHCLEGQSKKIHEAIIHNCEEPHFSVSHQMKFEPGRNAVTDKISYSTKYSDFIKTNLPNPDQEEMDFIKPSPLKDEDEDEDEDEGEGEDEGEDGGLIGLPAPRVGLPAPNEILDAEVIEEEE